MNSLAVFLGGGLGALARYLLSVILPKNCCFPMNTIVANFFGCFLATVFFTYFVTKSGINSVYKTFFIVGFCGGLSTLSALSLEVLNYIQTGCYFKACGYILISLLICAISVILGIALVKKYV